MDGRSARLGTGDWDAGGSFFLDDTLTTLAGSLDNGGFHSKFDPVQGDEPDDVLYTLYARIRLARLGKDTNPDPNNIDPITRDSLDLSESHFTVRSNDGRDWARQNAPMGAVEGRSMKKSCERVTKMRACEMMETWR